MCRTDLVHGCVLVSGMSSAVDMNMQYTVAPRSMEAHSFLNKKGYDIKSFGTGNMIKVGLHDIIMTNS